MKFNPIIRWAGGKRKQSEQIVDQFPVEINTYWEPCIGSGAVMYQLIHSKIKYNHIVASDNYKPLIEVWKLIQENPQKLLNTYHDFFIAINKDPNHYQHVVDRFNETGNPFLYYCIIRSCRKGIQQFDDDGNFCGTMEVLGNISSPEYVERVMMKWHKAIQGVEFRCCDYRDITPSRGDYVFIDPPYIGGGWYKNPNFDHDSMYEWLDKLPCDWSMTLNGDKEVFKIPEIYDEHMYVYHSKSKRSALRDSLYIRRNNSIYTEQPNIMHNQRGGGGADGETVLDMVKAIGEMKDMLSEIIDILREREDY